MKKFNLLEIAKTAFRLLVIFLICLIWSRYFISPLGISLFFAIILTFLIDHLVVKISKKRQQKQGAKTKQQEEIQNYANTFIFSTKMTAVNFFYDLAKTKHRVTKTTKYIVVLSSNKKIVLYPYFLYRQFEKNDLVEIYNSLSKISFERVVICTNKVDPKVFELASTLPKEVFVLDATDTYEKLYKKYIFFPEQTKLEQKQQNKYFALASYALNKKRTKGYFVASIFLILSSLISPYKIYYLLISTILLSLTFISLLNPKFNKIKENNLLEI